MTSTRKVLGQVATGAATLTKLYTVPALTSAVISSIIACNQGTASKFRVQIRVAGASSDPKQYIYYDENVGAGSAFIATIGLTLGATDEVWVYGTSANFSFSLYGQEDS